MKLIKNLWLFVLILCCTAQTVFAENNKWYSDYVAQITEIGIIKDMSKNFVSENNMSNKEFISAVLKLVEADIPDGISEMDYARQQGYILQNEMSDMTVPITRQSIAKVISRVLQLPDVQTDEISSRIIDWNTTCPKCKTDIAKCYKYGIMNGYEDNSFRGRYYSTQAEIAVILINAYNYKGAIQ